MEKRWADYLRAQRKQLLSSLAMMEAGDLGLYRVTDGQRADLTPGVIKQDKANVAEIERFLSEAGEPFE